MTIVETLERSLNELPDDERDQLGRTFIDFVQFMQERAARLPDADRRVWIIHMSQVLEHAWQALLVETAPETVWALARVAADASPRREGKKPTLAELEKLNAANRRGQWQQAVRESFSTAELEEQFGVSRQRLEQLRKQRKLFGLKPSFERGHFYPAWQFDDDGHPREVVPRLLDAAEEARLDPLSLHRLLVSETDTSDRPLLLALKAGENDDVLDAVRAAGAHGS